MKKAQTGPEIVEAKRRMLFEAIDAAPREKLAVWLLDAITQSNLSDQEIEKIGNMLGRAPHDRLRVGA